MKMLQVFAVLFCCSANVFSQTCGTGQASAACGTGTPLASNANIPAGQTHYFNAGGSPTFSNINLTGGTLRICSTVTINNLNQNSGNLIIESGGNLTVIQAGGWYPAGGTITVYGTLNFGTTPAFGIQNGVTVFVGTSGSVQNVPNINISNGSLNINNSVTLGGTISMSNGSTSMCIGNNSTVTINGATVDIQSSLTVNSSCTLNIPNGNLTLQNTSAFLTMGSNSSILAKDFSNNNANSFLGPSAANACFRYTNSAVLNSAFSTNPNIQVCSPEANPTQNWGSATVYPSCSGCGFSAMYWIGQGADNNWNTDRNWGTSSGGGDCVTCRPVSTSDVYFDGGTVKDCLLNLANRRVNRLIVSGYDGTIDLNGNTLSAISNDVNGSLFQSGTIKNGTLVLNNVGRTPSTLIFSGTSFGTSGANGPTVTATSPNIQFGNTSGSTFWGTVTATKTWSGGTNLGKGGNAFKNNFTLTNSSTEVIYLANNTGDTFTGDATFKATSSGSINVAEGGTNSFSGNIKVGSNSSGSILFGNGGGTSTLANNKTLSLDAIGFSAGTLQLSNFTYQNPAALTLTLAGSAYLKIRNSTFDPNVTLTAPQLSTTGTLFKGTTFLEKNSTTVNYSGGNTFQGATTLKNSSTVAFDFGDTNPDVFTGNLTAINTSTGTLHLAINSAGTQFNGNIDLQNSSTGEINFGNAGGTSTLASGKTISASTFANGVLRIDGFTTSGATAQTITVTGSARIRIGDVSGNSFGGNATITANTTPGSLPCLRVAQTTFNGTATISARDIEINSNTFQSTTSITKLTGAAGNDLWSGGNTFNGATTITNSSASRLRFPGSVSDTYNGNITFNRASTGVLDPAYSMFNTFFGDVTVSGTMTFGNGGGMVIMGGSSAQSIGGTATTVTKFQMNKDAAGNTVTLNTPVTISTDANFIFGKIVSSNANKIIFDVSATATGAVNNSHVNGPVQKIGTAAFEFPVGDGTNYRPISIGAAAGSNTFTAKYFKVSANTINSACHPDLHHVSSCEYWDLHLDAGASPVSVKLSWSGAACPETIAAPYVGNKDKLRIAHYDGILEKWLPLTTSSIVGTNGVGSTGEIESEPISSFSPFTLATETIENALPVELVNFRGHAIENGNLLEWETASEINSERFDIQRSIDGIHFEKIAETKAAGNSRLLLKYDFTDRYVTAEKTYYRLNQVDFDGQEHISRIIIVANPFIENKFSFFPNPTTKGTIYFNGTYSVRIVSLAGVVLKQRLNVASLDVSDLSPGIYFVWSGREVARLIIL